MYCQKAREGWDSNYSSPPKPLPLPMPEYNHDDGASHALTH